MKRFYDFVAMSPDDGAGGGGGGAPAGDAGGGGGFSMEPSFDISSMPTSEPAPASQAGQSDNKYGFDASQMDVPAAGPDGQKPAGAKPQDAAPAASGDQAPGAVPDAAPVPAAEGQPAADGAVPATATPAAGAAPPADGEPVQIPEAAAKVLVDTARALGIAETDPAKIPAAIEAHNARLADDRQAEQVRAREEADRTFDLTLREQAKEDVFALMRKQIAEDVKTQMRADGLPIDTKDWWENGTWDEEVTGPGYGEKLKSEFDRKFELLRQGYVTRPEWRTAEDNAYTARRTAHDTETTKITEMLGRYEHHAPDLIQDFRRAGADAASVERLAQLTHTHTARAISTVNSELVQTKALLAEAQQQISGHAAAIEAARLEGRAEAAAVRDQPNPASTGVGSPALAPMNVSTMEPEFALSSFSNFH